MYPGRVLHFFPPGFLSCLFEHGSLRIYLGSEITPPTKKERHNPANLEIPLVKKVACG